MTVYYCPWCWSECTVRSVSTRRLDPVVGVVVTNDVLREIRCHRHGILYSAAPDEILRMERAGTIYTKKPNWVK